MTLGVSAAGQISGGSVSIGQHAVAIDAQGNTYLAGSFTGDVTFGKTAGGASVEVNNSQSSDEGFVVSYAPNGTVNWLSQFTPSDGSQGTADSLTLDSAGTVYVAGTFAGTVNFDPAAGDTFRKPSSTDLGTGAPSTDAYLVGLSQSSGHVVHNLFNDIGKTNQSSTTVSVTDVRYDSSSKALYVTANYGGGAITRPDDQSLPAPSGGGQAGLAAKFDASNLTMDWAVNPLDENFGNALVVNAIAPNAANGVDYIVGDAGDSGGTASVVDQVQDGDGTYNNQAVFNSSTSVTASDVAVSGGGLVVVGSFAGQLTSSQLTTNLSTAGDQDAFILGLDGSSLKEVAGGRFGSSGTDTGDAVAVDGAGDIYMSGEDAGPASYGASHAPVLHGSDTSGANEAYVLQFSPGGGSPTGFQSGASGQSGSSEASSLAVTPSGKVSIAGSMAANVTFGGATLSNPTATAFFANLNPASTNGGGGNKGGGGGGGQGGGGVVTPRTTPVPTPAPTPPALIGEQRVYTGRGRHQRLAGVRLVFNGALNGALAGSAGNYRVTQTKGHRTLTLPVSSAAYDPGSDSVTISVAGIKANRAAQVTITGLAGANGAAIAPIVNGF